MATCKQCGVDHGGRCHQCVHSGKVAGDYDRSPCSGCRPAEARQQGHGRNVSYEELAPVLAVRPKQGTTQEPEDRVLDVLREFVWLDAVGRELLFLCLVEPESTLQEIASHLAATFRRPYTLQAVHWRIQVMRKRPVFARLLVKVDLRIA